VLDLGVAEVTDRALVTELPEIEVQAAKGVPESDNRVQFTSENGEVILVLGDLQRSDI